MTKIFDMYSELLKYPTDAQIFRQLSHEFGMELTDSGFELTDTDCLSELQEEYVECFDFNPKAALTLTTHVAHSDKEKSDIMETLNSLLNCYGIERTDNSSPDYLPDILRAYRLAMESDEDEEALLFLNGILVNGCSSIANALKKKRRASSPFPEDSGYVSVLNRLCEVLKTEVPHA